MKRSSLAVAAFGVACSHIVDLTQASSRQEIPTAHYTRENRRWRGAKLSPAERVEDECRPEFDHCYVTQGGGGFDGDDFHGTVYFHIGNGEYATVDY